MRNAHENPSVAGYLRSKRPRHLGFELIAIGVILGAVGSYFGRGSPVLFGQSIAILLPIAFTAFAVTAWIQPGARVRRSGLFIVVLVSLLMFWSYATASSFLNGVARNYLTYVFLMCLLLLLVKPVTARVADRTGAVLCWATAVIGLTVELWDRTFGPMPDARWQMWFAPLRELGIEFRWSGPFGHPNVAGPVMALALVYALSRSGIQRLALSLALGIGLVLSLSRTSILAAATGAMVVLIFSSFNGLKPISIRIRLIIAVLATSAIFAVAIAQDSSLDGRDSAYADYLRIWQRYPWFGAGEAGVRDYVSSGEIEHSHAHAHNLLIDSLARHGLVGAILLLVALISALMLSWSIRSQAPWPLAIILTFLVIGLAETPFDPLYMSVPLLWVLIAASYANGQRREKHEPAERPPPE